MVADMDQVQRDKSLMVNPDLHKRLRLHAFAEDKKLQEVVEAFLEEKLAEVKKQAAA